MYFSFGFLESKIDLFTYITIMLRKTFSNTKHTVYQIVC